MMMMMKVMMMMVMVMLMLMLMMMMLMKMSTVMIMTSDEVTATFQNVVFNTRIQGKKVFVYARCFLDKLHCVEIIGVLTYCTSYVHCKCNTTHCAFQCDD